MRRKARCALVFRRMRHRNNRLFAIVAVIVVMTIWGTTYFVTKRTAEAFPPLTLAFLRFVVAALTLAPVALTRGGLHLVMRTAGWPKILLMAFAGFAMFTAAFNYALIFGSASQGTLIYALAPASVAVASAMFLKERLSRRVVVGIALSISGVGFVILGGHGVDLAAAAAPLPGALFMSVAVLAWTAYTVMAKQLEDLDQTVLVAILSSAGALLLLPASIAEIVILGMPSPSLQSWGELFYLGAVAGAAAYLLYSFALRRLEVSRVGVFTNIDPLVGLVAAAVFLGEKLTATQAAGAALVLLGTGLASARA
jgi:drug/metabolite transporter (DMT)-like permease